MLSFSAKARGPESGLKKSPKHADVHETRNSLKRQIWRWVDMTTGHISGSKSDPLRLQDQTMNIIKTGEQEDSKTSVGTLGGKSQSLDGGD